MVASYDELEQRVKELERHIVTILRDIYPKESGKTDKLSGGPPEGYNPIDPFAPCDYPVQMQFIRILFEQVAEKIFSGGIEELVKRVNSEIESMED